MEKDLSDLDRSNQHQHSLNLTQIPFLDQLISKLTAFSIETEGQGHLFNSINVESKSNAERGKKATEVFETNRILCHDDTISITLNHIVKQHVLK